MPIRIPDSHEEPIRQLANMKHDDRHSLIQALRAAQAVIDPQDLITRVAKQSGLEESRVSPLLWMLMSMYRASTDPPEAFAKRVADAARRLFKDAKTASIDWSEFGTDLAAMLSCHDSLGVTSKTLDLRLEYGHVFCRARILTDIRPVFGADPETPPLAGAIVHTLRVSYHEGDVDKDFYVALDARNLRHLREVVERAAKKEASLKSELHKTGMQYLETEID